jgi:ribonuclease R
VGVIKKEKGLNILKNTGLDTEIIVRGKCNENDMVTAHITDWKYNLPEGKILKIIGNKQETNTQIHAILEEYNLPYYFSNKIENEAKEIAKTKEKDKGRVDRKDVLTFTIDPVDAKDFDDALSFKKTKENNFEVGVHIADVTHYLKENTLLDKEASSRATSVYLSDRVVPMLPEILSNDLCSLNPNEDKNVFSVIVEFDSKFDIVKTNFSKSLINSDERMSYEEAQFILENKKQELPPSVTITGKNKKVKKEIKEALLTLNSIAVGLKEKRRKKGSVFFNKEEIRFVVDKNGEPVDYKIKTQKEANHLIEEFMLLANILVAKKIKEKKRTAVFRIHDYPDEEKILELERFTRNLGYNVRLSNVKDINTAINNLLKAVENKPEKNVIDMMVIRSMSKAKYSTNNIGHFGLGFNDYTHFTSPIRRYPDVIVHRLLHSVLLGTPQKQENLESTCLHCSKMEELATKAERSSIKLMQVKYMSKRINEKFEAVVSGLNERGLFVEIKENKCEGLVRMKDIPNDYFIYDQRNTCVVGLHTHEEYCLGDEVIIKVIGTDLDRKHIDFKILEKK